MIDRNGILIVTSFWTDEAIGGVAEMSRTLAEALAKHQQVTVLVNRWEKSVSSQETMQEGCEIIFYRIYSPWNPNNPVWGFLRWLFAFFQNLYRLRKIISKNKIGVIQIRFIEPYHYIFRIIYFLGGPPYCVSFHGSDIRLFKSRHLFSRALSKWVLDGAIALSAVSESLASSVQLVFPEYKDIKVIRNGKSISEIKNNSLSLKNIREIDLPKYYFVNPANVTHVKGQDILIRAWAELPKDIQNVHLLIAGEARDLWTDCEQLIDELNCADRVHLLGPLPQADLFSIMSRSMGCVMASRSEGFSGSVIEAGALKRAVVCTDIPSFKEIIKHNQNGLIVGLDDEVSMANAITSLVRNPSLRESLGQSLYDDVGASFSEEKMAREYLVLYDEILDRGRNHTRIIS